MTTPSQMPSDYNSLSRVTVKSIETKGDGKLLKAEGQIYGRTVQIEAKVPRNFNESELTKLLNESFVGKATQDADKTKFELKNKKFEAILFADPQVSDTLKQIKKDKTSLNRLQHSATSRVFQTFKDAYASTHTAIHDFADSAESKIKEVASQKPPPRSYDRESQFRIIEEYCRNPKGVSLEFDPQTRNISVTSGKKNENENRETAAQILIFLDQKITEDLEAYQSESDKTQAAQQLKSDTLILLSLLGNRLPFKEIITQDDSLNDKITLLIEKAKI